MAEKNRKIIKRKRTEQDQRDPAMEEKGQKKSAQDNAQLRFSMILSSAVVIIMTIIVAIRGYTLQQRLNENKQRIDQLELEIEAETERTEDIEKYRAYTKTDEFIEETARDKLGLVYDDETIFKKQDSQ